MKRIVIITLLIVAAFSTAQGQSKGGQSRSVEQELMKLQRAEDEAESKQDSASLERLLSDDFIFTAPNGAISDKRKLINDVRNDEPDAEGGQTISYDDVKTRV